LWHQLPRFMLPAAVTAEWLRMRETCLWLIVKIVRNVVLETPVWVLRKAESTTAVIYCQIISHWIVNKNNVNAIIIVVGVM
jgi:hypothetical protein